MFDQIFLGAVASPEEICVLISRTRKLSPKVVLELFVSQVCDCSACIEASKEKRQIMYEL